MTSCIADVARQGSPGSSRASYELLKRNEQLENVRREERPNRWEVEVCSQVRDLVDVDGRLQSGLSI
jgi:hypothetical protein